MKIERRCNLLFPPHWERPVTCQIPGHWTSCCVLQVGAGWQVSRRVWGQKGRGSGEVPSEPGSPSETSHGASLGGNGRPGS